MEARKKLRKEIREMNEAFKREISDMVESSSLFLTDPGTE
jgi:hypothetical protein